MPCDGFLVQVQERVLSGKEKGGGGGERDVRQRKIEMLIWGLNIVCLFLNTSFTDL